MTLLEFYENYVETSRADVEVQSSYNGKVLCKRFNPKKHEAIGRREFRGVWCKLRVSEHVLSNVAFPVLCVYVDGGPEYEEEHKKRRSTCQD